jgi:hypothetical protein
MAAANIPSIEAALKRFYIGKIVEQINQESLLLDNFEKETVVWSGSAAIVALHTQRNNAVGAAFEGQTLPVPGQQGYEKIILESAYVYGQFSFTGPARAAAAKSAGAFANMMDLEMKPLTQDVRHYSDICMFTGGPVFGYLWEKNAALTTCQASVRTNYPVGSSPVGQTVKVYRLDTFAEVDPAARTVSSINATGTSVVLSAPINTSTVPAGVAMIFVSSAPQLQAEPIGLAGNLGSPTWFQLQRGLPQTATLSGNFTLTDPTGSVYADLTPNSLQNLASQIAYRSGSMPDKVWLSPLMIAAYSSLLQGVASGLTATAQRNDVKEGAKKGDLGFTGYSWAGIPIFQAQDCPVGVIYELTNKHWKLAELDAGQFDESTGSVLRAVPQIDAYTGMYRWYYQSYTDRPNASGAILGVNLPV